MLNICISFDYELFLGENYSNEDNILFKPTEAFINMLESEGITSTFFVDVCSFIQYAKYKENDYCSQFKRQLTQMIKRGQDVQLHIHPNWLKSNKSEKGWTLDVESYKIHYFGSDETKEYSMQRIISDGKKLLVDMLTPIDKDYKCIAYRAGGFCIQPEEELFHILLKNGIRIDSSVAPYLIAKGAINDYDFRNVPNQLNWWVNPKKGINNAFIKSEDSLYEVPIGTIRNNIFRILTIPSKQLRVKQHEVKGQAIQLPGKKRNKIVALVKNTCRRAWGYGVLSLDSRGYRVLLGDLEQIYKKYNCNNQDYTISIICHPKLASQDTIDNMRCFIQAVKKQNDKYSFVNMRDVYNKVIEGVK